LIRCRLCEANAGGHFATARLLGKYDVTYWRCATCGFVQTEEPYWLEEAYSNDVSALDLGPVNRCVTLSEKTRALILALFDWTGRFLDYGAGFGMFVRRMRDIGFDFRYYDKYSQNLFAKGFEAQLEGAERFELITAFEVFEHMAEPMAELQRLFSFADSIFFTTEVMPERYPKPPDWWYYAPQHGQHIAFYSRASLRNVARLLGVNYACRAPLHLLTRRRISEKLFRFVLDPRFSAAIGHVLSRYRKVEPLLQTDFASALGRKIDS
jgi:hypothetical protein